jgi:hypothetical protein
MTMTKDWKRCFVTCEEALAYLMRRRFLYLASRWENEYWIANLDYDGTQYTVTTAMRPLSAALA